MWSTRLLLILLFVGFLFAPGGVGAQPLAENTFETGTQGWTTDGPEAEHVSSGGRPGGYLEVEDSENVWYWEAPSDFFVTGTGAYNGALRFELKQSGTTALDAGGEDVVLEGESTTLTFELPRLPTADWTAYRVSLRPGTGWMVQSTGEPANDIQIRNVLNSLQAVRIRGNYWAEEGAVGLDNVRLQAAQTIERWVDPSQTYLHTNPVDDQARSAIAINLANVGLSPGDEIVLEQRGEYDYNPATQESTIKSQLLAVFSGSDNLTGASDLDRIPDAIPTNQDGFDTSGSLPESDIPEDFLVGGNVVEIPSGATHLFLSPYDGTFGDNEDSDQNFRLRILKPSPPSGLQVQDATSSVTLNWSASAFSTVSQYRVYRDTVPIDSAAGPGAVTAIASPTQSNYDDQSPTTGETYHYRVTAVDASGYESSFSWEVRATPGPTPSPPSNVRATVDGDSSVVVQWQSVADASKYRLYRDTAPITDGPGPRTPVDSTLSGDTDYVDTGLTPGNTYYYRITSVDTDGNESEYSAEVTARPPLSTIARPDVAVVAQADTTTVEVLANDLPGRASTLDSTTLQVIEAPGHGETRVDNDAGTIEYVHDGTDTFDDTFTYVVEDGKGREAFAQVALSIKPVALFAERDTIRMGRGQVDAIGPTARFSFMSAGDTSATGLSLTVGNQADYSVIEDTGEETLQPGGTRTVRVGFEPDEVGRGQTTSVTLSTKTGIASTVVLMGTGIDAQVDLSAEGGVATRGKPVDVAVTPLGPFEPTSRRLYARPSGGAYQELEDPSQIPSSLVTPKGVDFYLTLTDGDVSIVLPEGSEGASRRAPFHLPVQFDELTAPLSLDPQSYRMVSIPARVPIKQMLQKSYGGYNSSEWRVLRWMPSDGTYREFPDLDSLQAGMGFWLVTSGGRPFTLKEGTSVDASTPRQVVLKSGWNQVGTPFNFSVPWDTIQTASGLSDAQIDGPVGYRPNEGYQLGRSVLKPWESYFVFNATGRRDTLVVPPVGTGSQKGTRASTGPVALSGSRLWTTSSSTESQSEGGEARVSSKRAADRPFTLRVTARSKEGTAGRVWLGLREEADKGRDAFDFARPPSIRQPIRLSVQEEVRGRSVPHAGSFRPPEGEGQAWTLVLERPAKQTGAARSVRLQLQAEGALPSGQKQYLLDLDGQRRLVSGDLLSLKPGDRRRLKVIVGTRTFAEKKSDGISLKSYENALRGNAPNPFSGETTLTYVLEEETTVTLEVYNVLGQRVRTLVQERRDAGVHRVRWNGHNRYGEPAGSGVYFYRITAGDFQKTRKMVLVR